ncbi:ABC transporter permease [Coprococcus comes]|jgi:peptide/nickel transport system permease protein|uniref:ABC transporter permease n=1 Tax=Coprococcus comes TaxID=410072 RepID=A0A3R6DUQ9_9FIRM|nr:ABC transporter permease [Coprococcus comes]NSF19178.1 ABC transporter permease [Coprococcus comes]RGU44432.1 ABC transporter permease [Coprococcus comes]
MPLLIQELNGEVHPVGNNIVITNDSFAKLEKKKTVEVSVERQSVWKDIWKELRKNKVAMVSVVLLAILIIAVLLAPLSPYDPYKLDASQKLQGISSSHWFGTDEYGRDYFTRTLYGGRVSLLVGFMSMIMTVVIGTSLGVFSGYVGGKVDMFLMSFTDIFLALPSMLLMVILNTFLKPGLPTLIVVLSLFSWASVARITRAETMSLKERDFVVATQNLGASNFRVIIKHIIPNILGPVIVAASLSVANAILMESSLSFLGLGVQIPRASWGSMLQGAQAHILDYPLLAVYPGVMILITVLSFNLLGDILRNALEPKIVE